MSGYPASAEPEQVKAIRGLVQRAALIQDEVGRQTERFSQRWTPQRYLDENEREWNALDAICRSRPWATNRETPFKFPFHEVSAEMMKVEGHWLGWKGERKWTRGEATSEVVTNLIMGQEFPPSWRVLLFTPEFGNEHSFDKDNWTYLVPEDNTDVWIVSWQGWTNFDEMIEQVAAKVLSFADSVSTVWVGQGMGGLVAYEVMKYLQKTEDESPNLPVSLVTCDCPAPHLFSKVYRPFNMEGWSQKLANVQISAVQRATIEADVSLMKKYNFRHGEDKQLPVPISVLCHEGNPYASEDDVKAWEEYSAEGKFEFVDPLDEGEEEDYCRGRGFAFEADPALVGTVAEHNEKYNRWIEDDKFADIGPTDGPMPEEVECICVGAGTCGLINASEVAQSGKSVLMLDRNTSIGGVWFMHANTYSRVNTSEPGYRIFDKSGAWHRCNEDHSPTRSVMIDMHALVARDFYGCVRLETNVLNIKSPEKEGGDYIVKVSRHGKEHIIRCKIVHISVNRRLGKPRIVDYPGKEAFRGIDLYGYGNEMKNISFWGKKAIVVGAGAFAFENVRTCLEHGTKHCLMVCRREGTTCPKWIDMLAFMRPIDEAFNTNKSANMISFSCWQDCYRQAGLKTPACWDEGLLKPDNHTISVSDLAFIGGYHGLFAIKVGEVAKFTSDGKGVEFKDGETHETDLIIKCTGFHITDDAAQLTGIKKMQPYGLMGFNLNNMAEPLLDGAQFGSAKGMTKTVVDYGFTLEELAAGSKHYVALGFDEKYLKQQGNPFGSGATNGARAAGKFFAWLVNNPEEQSCMLKHSGDAQMNVEELWASQIGVYAGAALGKLIAGLSKLL